MTKAYGVVGLLYGHTSSLDDLGSVHSILKGEVIDDGW